MHCSKCKSTEHNVRFHKTKPQACQASQANDTQASQAIGMQASQGIHIGESSQAMV
ncbi:unnamed protein product [Arabis nemorensis]|uniref:Uncharacterized protein n=1 Tax=Arabis nemorensis TaxID=586526 RepID=A0A565AWP3_9BRAS|nr:unnamed protein product [Arabis nemorensis]